MVLKYYSFYLVLYQLLLKFVFLQKENTFITDNQKYENVISAFQEVAYSYYMRGKYIQYNSGKQSFFSPEEATPHNVNFLVCSAFARNVYQELLGITLPASSKSHIDYSQNYKTKPEVIAYSIKNKSTNTNNKYELIFKCPNNNNEKVNDSIKSYIKYLKVGDLLSFHGSNGGHTFFIYKIVNDSEAIIMESSVGIGKSYINTKIEEKNNYIYLNKKENKNISTEGPMEEGSLGMKYLSTYENWGNIEPNLNYSILRFIHKEKNGSAKLIYDNSKYPNDKIKNGSIIELSNSNMARINFKHLFIEKTVNKSNDNIVEKGEILTYKIRVINKGKKNYSHDLYINEIVHSNVKFLDSFNHSLVTNEKTLKTWKIGKLKAEEEKFIEYRVNVTGQKGNPVKSEGSVGNIETKYFINSANLRNVIGKNLDKNEENHINNVYNKLKNKQYNNSFEFIDDIYQTAFKNCNFKLNGFNIKELVLNYNISLTDKSQLNISKTHPFSNIVLNKYWSTLAYYEKKYNLKTWRDYTNIVRRQDFIYKDHFKTGDILIYYNKNDKKSNGEKITDENGEYAFIFINNTFIGKNYENNDIKNRNEFNAEYYTKHNLTLFEPDDITNQAIREIGNYQTLFGKDYYIILRPSLENNFIIQCLEGTFLNSNKNQCDKCKPGEYSLNGALSCLKCEPGYFSNTSGSSSCTKCPVGASSLEGESYCSKCLIGYYHSEGKCKICPPGTGPSFDSNECRDCIAGTYSKGGDNVCFACTPGYYSGKRSSKCNPCEVGTYSNDTFSSKCYKCEKGTYTNKEASSSCIKCNKGYYIDITGASSCIKCPVNYYSGILGASSCKKCPKGYYSLEGSSSCMTCPAGQYYSNGKCFDCKEGTFSNSGDNKCTNCPIGTFSGKKAGSCTKCQAGFYSYKIGAISCIKCPVGYYSLEGQSSCKKCENGQYLSGNKCLTCPLGTFSKSGAISCTKCLIGYVSGKGASSCTQCKAGFYSNKMLSSCLKCKGGTYSKPGSGSCVKCLSGYYSLDGASSCIRCPSGSYSSEGASSCKKCPNGQYLSKNKCYICNAGTYSKSGATVCTQCPAGSYSGKGAYSCIQCGAGKYSSKGSSKCFDCQAGSYSQKGAGVCTKCKPGFYSNKAASQCIKCKSGYFSLSGSSSCTKCPAGTYSITGSSSCTKCRAGYYSSAGASSCKQCPAGKYSKAGSSYCITCPKGKNSKAGASSCK